MGYVILIIFLGPLLIGSFWCIAAGRQAFPQTLAAKGLKYVAAGTIPLEENSPNPEPLTKDDIKRYIASFVQAAKNAVERAGFDGVEVHNANGYCECLMRAVMSTRLISNLIQYPTNSFKTSPTTGLTNTAEASRTDRASPLSSRRL